MKRVLFLLLSTLLVSCGAMYTMYGTKSLSYRIDNDSIHTTVINSDTISFKNKMPTKK